MDNVSYVETEFFLTTCQIIQYGLTAHNEKEPQFTLSHLLSNLPFKQILLLLLLSTVKSYRNMQQMSSM